MHKRVRRTAATLALAIVVAGSSFTVSGASAEAPASVLQPSEARAASGGFTDGACTMWASSSGFGGYCGGGGALSGHVPTWGQLLAHYQRQDPGPDGPFIPCRDFPIPPGTKLPDPPAGKTWTLRIWIVDYHLDQRYGGDPRLEREIVPVSEEDRDDCRRMTYMDYFWNQFDSTYPDPELLINPTYVPRVNVPAFFSLTARSSWVIEKSLVGYNSRTGLRMRAIVSKLRIDPGDGSKPFDCLMGLEPIGSDGYDETRDPFHQDNMCKYSYKRSSASQPDAMYKVKLSVYWEVAYWKNDFGWRTIGTYPVEAIQRLPVQEAQSVGG